MAAHESWVYSFLSKFTHNAAQIHHHNIKLKVKLQGSKTRAHQFTAQP